MARLCASDYEGVLAFLHEAYAADARDPFPVHVVERLRELVPSAAVTYREWEGDRARVVVAADDPAELGRIWREYRFVRHEDPFPGGPGPGTGAGAPLASAVKFSDVLTRRQLRRLALYDAVFHPLGLADTMKLFLPPLRTRGAMFIFDREGRDFTERDRAVVNTLAPHLQQLYARRHLGKLGTLTKREREIVEWVARGKTNAEIASILWLAPGTVRKHLDNVYAKLGVSNRAEAVASLFG